MPWRFTLFSFSRKENEDFGKKLKPWPSQKGQAEGWSQHLNFGQGRRGREQQCISEERGTCSSKGQGALALGDGKRRVISFSSSVNREKVHRGWTEPRRKGWTEIPKPKIPKETRSKVFRRCKWEGHGVKAKDDFSFLPWVYIELCWAFFQAHRIHVSKGK